MQSLKIVALFGAFLLLPSAVAGTGSKPGKARIFSNGEFTPHSRTYDDLVNYDLFQIDTRFAKGLFQKQPYKTRWDSRQITIALAYTEAPKADHPWLIRALELVTWQAANIKAAGCEDPAAEIARLVGEDRSDNVPRCLGPVEVNDLLTIDRVLGAAESEAMKNE
jgi:hypothetical protein